MANYRTEAPQVIQDFLRFQTKGKDLSDKTIDEYFLDLRTFFRFMKMERAAVEPDIPFDEIDIMDIDLEFLKGIRKVDINSFIDYLRSDRKVYEGTKNEKYGLSASSTQRKIACLKSFFSYYTEIADLLSKDPTTGVIKPKSRKTLPDFLTEEESYKLLQSISGLNEQRDYCIILISLTCGLRVSEIVGINIQDLQMEKDNYFLKIRGKGRKERQVYLSEACIQAVKEYLEVREAEYTPDKGEEDALFLSRKHKRMSVDAVQALVKKSMKAAGLHEYSHHKLRHTAATLMMQNGVDVRTVQEVLGHQSLSTTQIYTHVNSPQLRDATRANPMSKVKRN